MSFIVSNVPPPPCATVPSLQAGELVMVFVVIRIFLELEVGIPA